MDTPGKRLRQLRERLDLNQSELAEDMGITRQYYSMLERDERHLSANVVELLAGKYGVSPSWLILGIGEIELTSKAVDDAHLNAHPNAHPSTKHTKLGVHEAREPAVQYDSRKKHAEARPIEWPFAQEPNVYVVPVRAQAGYAMAANTEGLMAHDMEAMYMPTLKGLHLAFEVEGDSMVPTLMPGDYVYCRKLADIEELRPRTLAVAVTEEEVLIKRATYNTTMLLLESDNAAGEPRYVAVPEVKELWVVQFRWTGYIEGDPGTGELSQALKDIQTRLSKLEKEQLNDD